MNISSEILPADESFFNDTGVQNAFAMVVNIFTIGFGLPTNSYVIWLIVTGTGNGLAAELFSLNLSLCEIFLCLMSFFYFFSYSFVLNLVAISGQGLASTGRPLFQCLMCVERYLAVVHPVIFLKFKPLRYKVICSVFAWTAIFASCGVNILMLFLLLDFLFSFILTQLILFLSFQLFCCVAVLRALKQSGPGERGRERGEENYMKQRAFHVIVIITVTMVIIYAPVIISGFLFLSSVNDSGIVGSIAQTSYSLGGLVQPFLFIHRVGKLPFQLHNFLKLC